jgi:hypothetical protein
MASNRVAQSGPSQAYLENIHRRLKDSLLLGKRAKFQQGRILDEIITGEYWCRDDYPAAPEGGYPHTKAGFEAWCWELVGYKVRTVRYIRANYVGLAALKLNEQGETFARALGIGWWRLNHLLRVATDEASLVHWLDRIDNERLDSDKLRGEVEIALGSSEELDGPDPGNSSGTDAGSSPPAEPPEERVDPETGEPLATPEVGQDDGVRVEWPLHFQSRTALRTWLKGLEVVKRRLDTQSTMATYYMAHAPRDDEGGLVIELNELLEMVEQTWGVKLAVVEQAVAQPEPPARDRVASAAMEGFGT